MRRHLTHLSITLAIATTLLACTGGSTRAGANRRGDRGINERVALRGCVQPAPVGPGYALQHVIVLPSAEQPSGQDAIDNPIITRGSWVRLAGGQDATNDLKKYLNNEVTVTGEIVETVGTAGHEGGDAPKIALERVNKLADNCAGA